MAIVEEAAMRFGDDWIEVRSKSPVTAGVSGVLSVVWGKETARRLADYGPVV